jgi:hypothetical protein
LLDQTMAQKKAKILDGIVYVKLLNITFKSLKIL